MNCVASVFVAFPNASPPHVWSRRATILSCSRRSREFVCDSYSRSRSHCPWKPRSPFLCPSFRRKRPRRLRLGTRTFIVVRFVVLGRRRGRRRIHPITWRGPTCCSGEPSMRGESGISLPQRGTCSNAPRRARRPRALLPFWAGTMRRFGPPMRRCWSRRLRPWN